MIPDASIGYHSNTRSITEELLNSAGGSKQARAAFRAALSVWPGHETALWNEAQVAEEQHDMANAARAYEAIVNSTGRSDSRSLSALGWVLFRGGLAGRGERVLMEAARCIGQRRCLCLCVCVSVYGVTLIHGVRLT
jgi:hypothetical protein